MAEEVAASRAGQRVGNRYRLQVLLEEESASDLYSGVDETNRSKVWVRVLRDEYALQPKVLDHFAELPRQLMRQIGAGLPRVLAVGNDSSGIPYTVWEQLDGRDLEQTLRDADEPVTFDRAMELMGPVMDAVARLHDLGKAHGDLRPEVVLLADTESGTQPKLLHVGRPRDKAKKSVYAAPELAKKDPSAESDVYGLGMIFYRMLSGEAPKRNATTSLREAAPDVPEEVAALVESCLAADPDARPPNALELLARAEKIQKQLRENARRAKPKKRAEPEPDETSKPKPRKAKANGHAEKESAKKASDEVVATAPAPKTRAEPVVERRREKAEDKARRDAVDDALAKAKKEKDPPKEEPTRASDGPEASKASADAANAARKSAVQEALDKARKGAPKPDPEAAKAEAAKAAARQAAVQEALDKAKKGSANATDAKPAGPDDATNTHLYAHLWARKEKKKRNPLYTYLELAAFILFAWFLVRMTPTLTNPDMREVEAVLGPQFKIIGVAMALASFVVTGRMMVMQAKVFGTILQPAVMSMGATAMCISIAVTAPFAGDGFLQPFQALARQALSWLSGGAFALGGLFFLRWGKAQLATQVPMAAGSFAGAFVFALGSGGMVMHGLELPKEAIDFSREAEEELAEEGAEEEELEEGEIGEDGAKKVDLKLKGNLKDEANRVANRKRAPDDPLDEASLQEWETEQEGTVDINQRKEMGGGGEKEELDGVGVDQLRNVRKDNVATMKGVQKAAKAKMSFSE